LERLEGLVSRLTLGNAWNAYDWVVSSPVDCFITAISLAPPFNQFFFEFDNFGGGGGGYAYLRIVQFSQFYTEFDTYAGGEGYP